MSIGYMEILPHLICVSAEFGIRVGPRANTMWILRSDSPLKLFPRMSVLNDSD